jgi:hypothetical protein
MSIVPAIPSQERHEVGGESLDWRELELQVEMTRSSWGCLWRCSSGAPTSDKLVLLASVKRRGKAGFEQETIF